MTLAAVSMSVREESRRREESEHMSTNEHADLIDRLMDMYVEWREECVALWDAHERWKRATAGDRQLAFAAYRAALDREEWACHVYQDHVSRITPALTGEIAAEPAVAQRLAA
jgi:hypothetical protein